MKSESGKSDAGGGRKAFLLRIDPRLWDDLEAWAAAELRSVNGQIEYLLKQAIMKRKREAAPDMAEPQAPSQPQDASEAES